MPTAAQEYYSELTNTLKNAFIGDRFWFWYNPETENGYPNLMLSPFTEGMPELLKKTEQIVTPIWSSHFLGVCTIMDNGQFRFTGRSNNFYFSISLIKWVHSNVTKYPELAVLANAQINCEEQGTLIGDFSQPELWNITKPALAGTLADSLEKISTFNPGEEAFIWICDNGAENKPYLYVQKKDSINDGQHFVDTLSRLRRIFTKPGPSVRAVLRCSANGKLILATEDPIQQLPNILSSLIAENSSTQLETMILIQTKNGKPVTIKTLQHTESTSRDISDIVALLHRLQHKESAYFVFSGGELYASRDKSTLKNQLANTSSGSMVQGKLVRNKDRFDFRIRSASDQLLQQIMGWTATNKTAFPTINILSGSRVVFKDSTTDNVSIQKDDQQWNTIFTTGE